MSWLQSQLIVSPVDHGVIDRKGLEGKTCAGARIDDISCASAHEGLPTPRKRIFPWSKMGRSCVPFALLDF